MNYRIENTAILIGLLVCLSACGGGGSGDEGGILSGVTSKFLGEIGNPGSEGPVNIKLETASQNLSVARGSSIRRAVSAVSAGRCKDQEQRFADTRIESQICEKGIRGKPLTDEQKQSNIIKIQNTLSR